VCLVCPPGGFPGGSPLLAASRPGPSLPPPAGKPRAGSCWPSTKRMVHVSRDAGTRGVSGDRKRPRFCLECRCRAWANPRSVLLTAFFPSSVQVLRIVRPPCGARLVVCRGDQQGTGDHRRPFPAPANTAQGRGKQGKVDGQVETRCIRQLSRCQNVIVPLWEEQDLYRYASCRPRGFCT
jgi:hypothetical protein